MFSDYDGIAGIGDKQFSAFFSQMLAKVEYFEKSYLQFGKFVKMCLFCRPSEETRPGDSFLLLWLGNTKLVNYIFPIFYCSLVIILCDLVWMLGRQKSSDSWRAAYELIAFKVNPHFPAKNAINLGRKRRPGGNIFSSSFLPFPPFDPNK